MFIMDAHLTEAQGPLIPVWSSLATDVFQTRRISGEPMGGGYLPHSTLLLLAGAYFAGDANMFEGV